jgi:hypothetical protein
MRPGDAADTEAAGGADILHSLHGLTVPRRRHIRSIIHGVSGVVVMVITTIQEDEEDVVVDIADGEDTTIAWIPLYEERAKCTIRPPRDPLDTTRVRYMKHIGAVKTLCIYHAQPIGTR